MSNDCSFEKAIRLQKGKQPPLSVDSFPEHGAIHILSCAQKTTHTTLTHNAPQFENRATMHPAWNWTVLTRDALVVWCCGPRSGMKSYFSAPSEVSCVVMSNKASALASLRPLSFRVLLPKKHSLLWTERMCSKCYPTPSSFWRCCDAKTLAAQNYRFPLGKHKPQILWSLACCLAIPFKGILDVLSHHHLKILLAVFFNWRMWSL